MIKAILFDVDGVIIRREKYFSQRAGLPEDKIKPFFEGIFQKCLIGEADLKHELTKYIKDWEWDGTVDELMDFWFSGEREIDEKVMKYVAEIKKKGLKVFLATNNERYRIDYLLKELHLEKFFDKMYGSGYVGHMKPHAGFFQHILKEQKLLPHEVLFWDDDIVNVEGAKQVGMHAEFFSSLEHMKKKIEEYEKI